ncbi:MAG: hypothetical protein Q7S53_03570 [bacterium]|nr:hypothetical protein [bacterium]
MDLVKASKDDCIFKCRDYKKVLTHFTKKNYYRHAKKRPILLDKTFLPPRVKEALVNPSIIMPSHNDKDAHCYYHHEISVNRNINWYTKVVVHIGHTDVDTKERVNYIKTAWRVNLIKELAYNKKPIYYDGTSPKS